MCWETEELELSEMRDNKLLSFNWILSVNGNLYYCVLKAENEDYLNFLPEKSICWNLVNCVQSVWPRNEEIFAKRL